MRTKSTAKAQVQESAGAQVQETQRWLAPAAKKPTL